MTLDKNTKEQSAILFPTVGNPDTPQEGHKQGMQTTALFHCCSPTAMIVTVYYCFGTWRLHLSIMVNCLG